MAGIEQLVEVGAQGQAQAAHIGLDGSVAHLEQHVAAPFALAGAVVAGGNIGSGELGELLHKASAFAAGSHVAAEDQDVGIGLEARSPTAQLIPVIGQVAALE